VFIDNINNKWRNVNDCTNLKDMENRHGVTWEQRAALEPELTELLTVARMVGNGCRSWHDVERGSRPVHDRHREARRVLWQASQAFALRQKRSGPSQT
jgi:hypothetical protein